MFCHAGCRTEDILESVGLTFADLFFNDDKPSNIYQYRDADGNLAYEKLKYQTPDGKTFKQRHIDSNGNIVK